MILPAGAGRRNGPIRNGRIIEGRIIIGSTPSATPEAAHCRAVWRAFVLIELPCAFEKACLRLRFQESYLKRSICDPMTATLEKTAREVLKALAAARADSEVSP